MQAFLYYLSEQRWEKVYKEKDVDQTFEIFQDEIITLFNLCFKTKKSLVKPNKKKFANSLNQNTNNLWNKLKQLTSKTNKEKEIDLLINTRRKRVDDFIRNSENKIKAAWSIVNEELRKHNQLKRDAIITNEIGQSLQSREACNYFQ